MSFYSLLTEYKTVEDGLRDSDTVTAITSGIMHSDFNTEYSIDWLRRIRPNGGPFLLTWKVMAATALRHERQFRRAIGALTHSLYEEGGVFPRDRILTNSSESALLEKLLSRQVVRDELWSAKRDYSGPGVKIVAKHRALPILRILPWLPWELRPDLQEADEYTKECRRLQATKAGRKAKRLLLSQLTEAQQRDYFRRGIFMASGHNKDGLVQLFIIDNSYPNGNIFEVRKGKVIASYCLHPEEPYPLDDILLTQKLAIEESVSEVKRTGHRTAADERSFIPTMSGYR